MISRVSRFMTALVSKYLPDPLIFAVLLTFITFVCALCLTDSTPIDLVNMWGGRILEFTCFRYANGIDCSNR